jgi:3-hydroxyanthranilate 3,4-dioxygenase
MRKPFDFKAWIAENEHLLKPPVGNKLLFEDADTVVQIVGGPNQRVDFHDDPVEEFFYQLRGDMVLKVHVDGRIQDIPIREGQVFLLPAHVPHSPQRPQAGSVGLVVEGSRPPGAQDAFEWYCFECNGKVHRIELVVKDIVKDLPPLYAEFYASEEKRTCPHCGRLHPGKTPPEGWASL